MKKITTILILLISLQVGFAQKHEMSKKIKALKTAHITNELDLSSLEAEKFWPIYNASNEKEHTFRKEMHELRKKAKSDLSEKEAQTLLTRFTALSDEIHLSRRQLIHDLKNVLPAKKIILLKKAEEDFKRKLFRQFKDKRRPEGGAGRPPREGRH